MSTLYDRLGVAPTATISEIRSAFRRRARQLHPDVSGAPSPEMAAVNEAWAILSDRARRERYDTQLGAEAVGAGDLRPGSRTTLREATPWPPAWVC